MAPLTWRHHTLIQALLSGGPLKANQFHSLFYQLTGKTPDMDSKSSHMDIPPSMRVLNTSPESASKVLVSQAYLFKPKYPTNKERLIGTEALFFQQRDYYSSLKMLVQANFLLMAIKQSIPELEGMGSILSFYILSIKLPRNASILSFTFREAAEDVEFDGYMIPKGWKVLHVFRSIHKCAELYPQPDKFDPSRFEVPPRPNTYMPFGNGVHSCPRSELAKLEMLIFLHRLTINYRWKVIEGQEEGIQYFPFPVPKKDSQ